MRKIEYWQEQDRFDRAVEAVAAASDGQRSYALTLLLAQAYLDLGEPEDAILLLNIVQAQGKDDSAWNRHMACALYAAEGREEEALPYIERWAQLSPEDADAAAMLEGCMERIIGGTENVPFKILSYEEDTKRSLEEHITKYFGSYVSLLHETKNEGPGINICVIPPNGMRDYYTLVTMGMSHHKFTRWDLPCTELMITLPPDWEMGSAEGRWYWPVRLLRIVARRLADGGEWFGYGTAVELSGEEAYPENPELCGVMLVEPTEFGRGAELCQLSNNDTVSFYRLIPLYREELNLRMLEGADALLNRFTAAQISCFDPARPDVLTLT